MYSNRNNAVGPQVRQRTRSLTPNWGLGIAFLIAPLVGLAVATQWVARGFQYSRLLGLNAWGLYPPWSYFTWAHAWDSGTNHLLFNRGFGVGILTALGILLAGVAVSARTNFKVNPFLHGSARWASKKDLKRAGLLNNDGVYVGAWINPRTGRAHYLRHAGPEHVLCYAPTRSGKGVGLVIPTLLSWTQSAIITDLKGELWSLTAGWRQQHAGNNVLRFEPAAASGCVGFNPLEEIRIGTEHEVGDAQNLATLIVDPDGKGLQDHWQTTAQTLIAGCIIHLLYKAKQKGDAVPNLSSIDLMLANPEQPVSEVWKEMLTYPHIRGRNHPLVGAAARDMIDRPATEAGSVLSTAKKYFALYRDPVISRNISQSQFKIRDLMNHENPISLYIITQPEDKARLRPLVRVLVNMIVRLLASKLDFIDGRPVATYQHRLLMMLDEFPSLGKLDIMQESLAFIAGYGIKCYLICQDINQLQAYYGREEAITSNCHVQCAFPPNRLETAEHLSKLTGQTTVVKQQITTTAHRFGGLMNVSKSFHEIQRPLLTPDECQRMPGPLKDTGGMITEAGDMVIYCAGFPAIYGRQPLYFSDEAFRARAAIEAPSRTDTVHTPRIREATIA